MKTCIGYAMCGSFCTFRKAVEQMKNLKDNGYDILPIMSDTAYNTDTRFGKAKEFISEIENIAQKSIVHTITSAEPIGPKYMCDIMLVAPCTGNTLSKIANGITDTPVTMAVKSHLRVEKPVLLCIASNDALGASAQNIGKLLNTKNIYFVPMSQDAPIEKPNSLISHFDLIEESVKSVQNGIQPQPIFR